MPLRIATWNLCLGLQNKNDIVLDVLHENNIDLCCLQETKISQSYPINILSSQNYELEVENNDTKRRVALYISRKVKYTRKTELEEENTHIVIVNLDLDIKIRIITLYRSYQPLGNISPSTFF